VRELVPAEADSRGLQRAAPRREEDVVVADDDKENGN
jgi:hypothetical protein